LRRVEELAAEMVVGKDSVVVAAAEVAAGIEMVVAEVGRRRSPVVEVDRMHQAIVPVVSGPEVARAMDFEEQLIVVCQMGWMEQMFVIVSFSRRGWTVAETEAAGIAVCLGEDN
jgi:hypothetical protein